MRKLLLSLTALGGLVHRPMRKLLLSLTALGGLTLAGLATAEAASALPLAPSVASAQVRTVQYYGPHDRWHHHEWRRWHRWHHWHHDRY